MGRPTDYRPEYCERVIELGKLGKSHAQIAAALDVSRMTLYRWAEADPKFSDAITHARDLAQAWFEDKGQEGLTTPGFNASLWAKQVSCRFRDDYTDTQRRELTGKDGGPVAIAAGELTDEQLAAIATGSR
jgi:hypothetical protein